MAISGHKTRAVFDRYHIVSDRRWKENTDKLELHIKAKDETAGGPGPYSVNVTEQDSGARHLRDVTIVQAGWRSSVGRASDL
jgi:hypothetical protein